MVSVKFLNYVQYLIDRISGCVSGRTVVKKKNKKKKTSHGHYYVFRNLFCKLYSLTLCLAFIDLTGRVFLLTFISVLVSVSHIYVFFHSISLRILLLLLQFFFLCIVILFGTPLLEDLHL